MEQAGTSLNQFVGVIEQGPAGIRLIAFFSSVGSVVLSVMAAIDIRNITQPVKYAISIYQVIFSLTSMLFEAKPEWIAKIPGLDGYQNMLIDYVKALTVVGGRGLFYGFQGLLWLSYVNPHEFLAHLPFIIEVLLLVLVGVFCGFMHFGIMPSQVTAKVRTYVPLPQAA